MVYSCSKVKAVREGIFALHCQQPDKDKQNVDVAPPGKISADANANGVRKGGVLSPYLFAVYLDDLSNELNNINNIVCLLTINNIKAERHIGEVL